MNNFKRKPSFAAAFFGIGRRNVDFMSKITKLIDRVSSAFSVVSGYVFAVVVLVVIINVIGRAVLNTPVRGIVEFVQLGMLLSAGIVLCKSGFDERHICVTLLIDRFPGRVKSAFVAFAKLVATCVFGMTTYLFFMEIPKAITLNKVTDSYRLPYYLLYVVLAISFTIGTLVFFYQFCVALSEVFKGTPKTADLPEKSGDESGPNEY